MIKPLFLLINGVSQAVALSQERQQKRLLIVNCGRKQDYASMVR
jgi:hypothetical protein